MNCFYISGINLLFRTFRRIYFQPLLQLTVIANQHTKSVPFPLFLNLSSCGCSFWQNIRNMIVILKPEICGNLFCCILIADLKQSGNKVNHIACCTASKAVIILVVQLQTGRLVGVEWAFCHPTPIYLNPIMFCGCYCGNRLLYHFK